MSTRSFVIQQSPRGFAGIYCHWDGYPEHNGRILLENYSTPETLAALIAHGDLSVLAACISECEFYRDRGDAWDSVKPTIRNRLVDLVAIANRSGCEYVYFFDGTDWQVGSRGSQCFGLSDGTAFSQFRPLAEAFSPHAPKARALARHLGIGIDAITEQEDNLFTSGSGEFLVLTDEEADEAFQESLSNFFDECVLPDIPEHLQSYIDEERWKADAAFDGRGHSLATYDGNECEEDEFFIYRLN